MKIGLLDHMGYGNLGDAATQEALIANIHRRLPDTEIIGFSLNPEDTRKRHGIVSYSITHWHPGLKPSEQTDVSGNTVARGTFRLKSFAKKIPVVSGVARKALDLCRELLHLVRSFRRVKSLDALIIAGGGQLADLWHGPWSHPYNVLKFSVLAKLARKKLLFVNVGAGPLNINLSRLFVKFSVSVGDYVSVRDVESQALLKQLGLKRDIHVFPDSAYALDVSKYRKAHSSRASAPLVGINPIGFCDPRIWPEKDQERYSCYLDKLAEFLLWLRSQNCRLKVFSGESSVDTYALEDLKSRLLARLSPMDVDGMFIAPSRDVEDLLTLMSQFDFVVTSKFHGVVFSHLLNNPVIALSYHHKIDDLMRSAGHSRYCLNIENFDSGSLNAAFTSLVENVSELTLRFHEITLLKSKALAEQFDSIFLPRNLPASSSIVEQERNQIGFAGSIERL